VTESYLKVILMLHKSSLETSTTCQLVNTYTLNKAIDLNYLKVKDSKLPIVLLKPSVLTLHALKTKLQVMNNNSGQALITNIN
jgi:hypothetical protein